MLPIFEWQYHDHLIAVRFAATTDIEEWQVFNHVLNWMLDQARCTTHILLDFHYAQRLPFAERELTQLIQWHRHPNCGWTLHVTDAPVSENLSVRYQTFEKARDAIAYLQIVDASFPVRMEPYFAE